MAACIMHIGIDDLSRTAVHELLNEHLQHMYALSPPEQVFALDLSQLRAPDITFWTAWDDGLLLGCGALKELSPEHGEIKSMRTPETLRGRGAGRALLNHIIETAKQRRYDLLSLETGTHPAFLPARRMYQSAGFQPCGPFAEYKTDPHSLFMRLRLGTRAA
jgi:putative acetyltransferase